MKRRKAVCVLMLAAMLTALVAPAALAEASTVHIATAEDLTELAKNCRLDTYSDGLTVVLDNDIDLEGIPFAPIPSFMGTFKGNGYTISGFVCANNGSHQGFFRYIEETGVVTGLTVIGEVLPEDSRTDIGGLVGTNRGTVSSCTFTGTVSGLINVGGIAGENYGKIIDCTFNGKVSGKQFTGGITGYSEGRLIRCTNTAEVNTEVINESINLEQLSLLDLTNLDLISANDSDVVSDTGGIVGMSVGSVTDCKNTGTVGYQHYGYNVGGIVGRQSGYVNHCINYGLIYGRTDVGGIIGQMEPFLILTGRDTLADAIDDLSTSTNSALGNLSRNAAEAGGTMDSLQGQSSNLANDAATMEQAKAKVDGKESVTGDNSSNEDDGTSFADVVDKGSEIAGTIGDAAGNVDDSTYENIANGNVSADDVSDIAGAASGPASDAADDIAGRIQEKNEEEEQNQQEYDNSKTSVTNDLNGMSRTLGALNQQLSDGTVQLSGDLTSVNYNFNRVMTLISNALTGDFILNIYDDISEWDSEDNTEGKVFNCINYATISGDDNVGGVAGNMGVENQYDMEGVVSELIGGEGIFSATYSSKCIVRSCQNKGTVTGKKTNVGGIVGLCKMGSVFDSENYGNVASTNGNYVGGIAGYSYTYINNCYAMCDLEGVEYVGGIAGYGTRIIDCVTLIGLSGEKIACVGAIAGWADTTMREVVFDEKGNETEEPGEYYVRGNMFVDNGMGAVDGISYSGRAEPALYTEILKKEGLPEAFSTLKLSFVADGELIKEVVFEYGGAVEGNEIPDVPAKDGYTGHWEAYDYSKLYFSDTVEAVYVANQTSLAVQDARSGSPMSILLLEGEFQDGASVMLEPYTGTLPTLGQDETLLEAWTMKVEDNAAGGMTYTVRYLPPEVDHSQNLEIYIKSADGTWKSVPYETSGSYLVFRADGSEMVFVSAAKKDNSNLILAGIAGGVIVFAGLLIAVVKGIRKKKDRKADQTQEPVSEIADITPEETETVPTEMTAEMPNVETEGDGTAEKAGPDSN